MTLANPAKVGTVEKAKVVGAKTIAEIDERELAVRMAEAAIRIKRPPGKSLDDALASMPADWGDGFRRAARAAMEYWNECIQNMQKTN